MTEKKKYESPKIEQIALDSTPVTSSSEIRTPELED